MGSGEGRVARTSENRLSTRWAIIPTNVAQPGPRLSCCELPDWRPIKDQHPEPLMTSILWSAFALFSKVIQVLLSNSAIAASMFALSLLSETWMNDLILCFRLWNTCTISQSCWLHQGVYLSLLTIDYNSLIKPIGLSQHNFGIRSVSRFHGNCSRAGLFSILHFTKILTNFEGMSVENSKLKCCRFNFTL